MLTRAMLITLSILASNTALSQAPVMPQTPNSVPRQPTNLLPESSRPIETVIQYFNDPVTGRPMEVVKVDVPVHVQRWEAQEMTEKRIETQWVIENQKTVQWIQTPSNQTQLEPQYVGWFNSRVEYVPRQIYYTTPVTVEQPVRVPKYVEVERKVQVPKLVPKTEYVTSLYQRERTASSTNATTSSTTKLQTDPNLANKDRPNPMQMASSAALTERHGLYGAALPASGKYPLTPMPGSNTPNMNAYAATQPIIQMPGKPISTAWTSTQLAFQQTFAPNQQSVMPPTANSSLRQNTISSTFAPPQIASAPNTYREPTETGLGATVLR